MTEETAVSETRGPVVAAEDEDEDDGWICDLCGCWNPGSVVRCKFYDEAHERYEADLATEGREASGGASCAEE